MQYEPQCFELRHSYSQHAEHEQPTWLYAKYLPDFLIQDTWNRYYVEIKPDPIQGEDSWRSVALACILGYEHQTIIVSGWPLRYQAFMIDDQEKGNPAGQIVRFYSGVNSGEVNQEQHYRRRLYGSYPSEDGLTICEHDRREFGDAEDIEAHLHQIASSAWNETKFKWIAKNSRDQNK